MAPLPIVGLQGAPAFAQPEATGETTGRARVGAGMRPKARPRVVLLAVIEDDPLAARLGAELEALGLDVSRGKIDPVVAIEDLVKQALLGGARGVVVADGRRTEFWVAEEGSDRIAMRQELEIESSPAMESVLSLRTVEFLRVSLGLAGRAAVPPPPVVAPPPAPPVEPDRRVAFGVVSGIVAATGRLAPYGTVGAALRVRVVGPVGIEIRGLAPLGSQQIAGPAGPIDTSVWLAGGGLVFTPRLSPIGFEIGAGVLAAAVRGSGTASSQSAMGVTDYAVGLAFYGRVAGRLQLSRIWALRLDVMGGTTAAQRPSIGAIQDSPEKVTSWGVGFVAALGGVEAAF